MVIAERLVTFYGGFSGIVWLVRYPIGYFVAIFAMMGWSLQSVWVKQLIFCEGKVKKTIRLRQGIL